MTFGTTNARITSTMLGYEDHGILTAYIYLDYGGSGQAFGGFAFDVYDRERKERVAIGPFGMEFVRLLLQTVGVKSWEKLPGTHCRVKNSPDRIEAIGNILTDKWFNPREISGAAA